ncbi:MAG: hypothetical protein AABW93_04145 [Nanoarchaeota archaeon]
MGKYNLKIENTEGPGVEVESEFLPRKGDEYLNDGKIFYVCGIRHITTRKEGNGKLEAKVEVHLKI